MDREIHIPKKGRRSTETNKYHVINFEEKWDGICIHIFLSCRNAKKSDSSDIRAYKEKNKHRAIEKAVRAIIELTHHDSKSRIRTFITEKNTRVSEV